MTLGENIISKVLGGERQWCCHSLRGYACACSERVTGTPGVAQPFGDRLLPGKPGFCFTSCLQPPSPAPSGHSCWQLQSPAWDQQTDGPGFLGQFQFQMFFLVVKQMYCFLVQKLWSTLCIAINPVSSCRFCLRKVQP